jgi:flagellar biosynthesis protein FlhF
VTDREVNVMLVLPAWLRANDVTRVLEMYDDPLPTQLVVTKLDETYQVGGILHAALPSELPFAYLCNGPRVPEDILDASVDGVLDAVFPSEA